MEKEYGVRRSDTRDIYIVIRMDTWREYFKGTLADCYAYIKLMEEGYDVVI